MYLLHGLTLNGCLVLEKDLTSLSRIRHTFDMKRSKIKNQNCNHITNVTQEPQITSFIFLNEESNYLETRESSHLSHRTNIFVRVMEKSFEVSCLKRPLSIA